MSPLKGLQVRVSKAGIPGQEVLSPNLEVLIWQGPADRRTPLQSGDQVHMLLTILFSFPYPRNVWTHAATPPHAPSKETQCAPTDSAVKTAG